MAHITLKSGNFWASIPLNRGPSMGFQVTMGQGRVLGFRLRFPKTLEFSSPNLLGHTTVTLGLWGPPRGGG